MISSDFLDFISRVRENLLQALYKNETSVREQIVRPVLEYLGWDVNNPRYVYPEFPLEGRRVDYGLMVPEDSNAPRCIIEVKTVGNMTADRQLFEYAFHAGSPLAFLTDGKRWRFYLPMSPGSLEERLVRTLDFEEHSANEVAEGLVRYLSFDNTHSGRARKNAEDDRDKRIGKDKARKNIFTAWERLLDGTFDKLVNLVIEETSLISESAPERSDVEKFLRNLKTPEQKPELLSRKKQRKAEPKKPQKKSGNEIQFVLLGKEYSERTAAKAYARIMKILAARNKDFTTRLAPLTAGRKKKWLSQNREDMVKIKMSEEISPGWWLDTNLSNESKIKRLEMACKIAGIPFGKPSGLKITF